MNSALRPPRCKEGKAGGRNQHTVIRRFNTLAAFQLYLSKQVKISFQIKIFIRAATLIASTVCSQEVTAVNGQIYSLLSLPRVKVPSYLSYVTIGYNGVPKQPILLQGSLQGNPATNVTFKNFPFDPKDFSPVYGANGLQPSHTLYCRALKTSEVTNWNALGQPASVDTVYDCGSSLTNAVLAMPSP